MKIEVNEYNLLDSIKKLKILIEKSNNNIYRKTEFLIFDVLEVKKIQKQNSKIFFEANKGLINEFLTKKVKNLLEKELENYFINLKKELYENSQINN